MYNLIKKGKNMSNHQENIEKLIGKEKGIDFSPKFFETSSPMGKFQRVTHVMTTILEASLSLVLIAGIIVSAVHIPGYFSDIFNLGIVGLGDLVNYSATIIILIELIHVLNLQNLKSIIEILMIAFVRELVIREWDMWQLLLGVMCIAGLFATSKYLMVKDNHSLDGNS